MSNGFLYYWNICSGFILLALLYRRHKLLKFYGLIQYYVIGIIFVIDFPGTL